MTTKRTHSTINWVVDNNLCTGCGVCAGVCPPSALKMHIVNNGQSKPILDEALCTSCGICLEICPGKGVKFEDLVKESDIENAIIHPEIGIVRSIMSCNATDDAIREGGASGGFITALTGHILETGKVSGVVVVVGIEKEPFCVQARIARTKVQLLLGQQSKYLVASFDEVVKEIIHSKDNYAIVGLPCQISSIRSILKSNTSMQKRIKLLIGLFCGYTLEKRSTEILCGSVGVNTDQVSEFLGWRVLEYPGSFAFKTRKDELYHIPLRKWLDAGEARFANLRCHICPDGLARCADISVGDLSSTTKGLNSTLAISRTKAGDGFIESAQKDGWIGVEHLCREKMMENGTIAFMRRAKVRMPLALIRELEHQGKPVPVYDLNHISTTRSLSLSARSFWTLSRLTRNRSIDRILTRFPKLNQIVGHEVYRHHGRRIWKMLVWLRILR